MDQMLLRSSFAKNSRSGAEEQHAVVSKIWGACAKSGQSQLFDNYRGRVSVYMNDMHCAAQCHTDLIDAVAFVRRTKSRPLKELVAELQYAAVFPAWLRHQEPMSIEHCLRFAASLWLCISLKSLAAWTDNLSLHEFVTTSFPTDSQQPIGYFELTEKDLERIGNIRVLRTPNLNEHLVYDDEKRELLLFGIPAFLDRYNPSLPTANCQDHGYPQEVLDEALQSLKLLATPKNSMTRQIYHLTRTKTNDIEMGKCDSFEKERRIAEYRYFGHRLLAIKQAYDEAEPKTIQQLWYDRRRITGWVNFRIAIVLAIVYGLVQSVAAIIQVVNSF